MPVYFDTVERLWRTENDAGQIVGYYPTEGAALAALQPAEPAEQDDDSDFVALLRLIDTLADMHGLYDPEPAEAEEPCEPEEAPAPSEAYHTIAAVLAEGERMPTGAELYALRINDPIMSFVWARIEDWTLYKLGHGYPVKRNADTDRASEEYEVARSAALARLQERRGFANVKITDDEVDGLVRALGVLNEAEG